MEESIRNLNMISIIMPVYNTPSSWLEQSIISCLNQTHQNFELLIIDNESIIYDNPISKIKFIIYNTNLTVEHTVEARTFSNAEKKQYIQGLEGKMAEALVVNRGNGNSKYKLQYALIGGGGGFTYLVENHLNEIYYEDGVANGSDLLASVVQSFKNPKTQLFIDFYLGNNGLSKTELETIFPIYL